MSRIEMRQLLFDACDLCVDRDAERVLEIGRSWSSPAVATVNLDSSARTFSLKVEKARASL